MNRDNFAKELKVLREGHNLSQEELAFILSSSHRVFQGVNQVMISQWEHGKRTPSFVRRLGVASFFQQNYDFAIEEIKSVKSSIKDINLPTNSDLAYDYEITSVETVLLEDLNQDILDKIRRFHNKLYMVSFDNVLKRLQGKQANVTVIKFLSQGLMIGHLIYDSTNNTLLSMGAVNVKIRRQIFAHFAQLLGKEECIVPVNDPAMGQLLYDMYVQPCCSKLGVNLFIINLNQVIKNPFIKAIYDTQDIYFKYLRYHDLKSKKKSLEFLNLQP
ncbi:helix-turn-helix transcriptional regulator [Vibrio brasiliensis]|uniref:helix-turn-helix domain-containing protein n=1 Tax=Vibrio brasiliensis TaxID=170652 RepID=UPI001EFDD545|nr:helix-turn-helix transcriptional regulator [Vibrio brasiliensis]MCG9753501.1 helix-turn-helix transcriptional regulator [Vibrio brasiliensis]